LSAVGVSCRDDFDVRATNSSAQRCAWHASKRALTSHDAAGDAANTNTTQGAQQIGTVSFHFIQSNASRRHWSSNLNSAREPANATMVKHNVKGI
jgi:hypothetical protein